MSVKKLIALIMASIEEYLAEPNHVINVLQACIFMKNHAAL
jgi:hypothetical protein